MALTEKDLARIKASSTMAHHALMLGRNCCIVEDRIINGTETNLVVEWVQRDWALFSKAYQEFMEANRGA